MLKIQSYPNPSNVKLNKLAAFTLKVAGALSLRLWLCKCRNVKIFASSLRAKLGYSPPESRSVRDTQTRHRYQYSHQIFCIQVHKHVSQNVKLFPQL